MQDLINKHWSHGPHYQFKDSIVFITWRLAFTLPQHILALFQELKSDPVDQEWERDHLRNNNAYLFQKFQEYDLALANFQHPGFSLNETDLAAILKNAFHYFDGERYELHAYCVMPNHVHVLMRALPDGTGNFYMISDILKSLKQFTANQINKLLGRKGQVWDDYYFDRVIRDIKNYQNVVAYILANPVAAGFIENDKLWKDSFLNTKYVM